MSEFPHEAEQERSLHGRRMPYFRFYADDYLAGTRALTYEEKGFYIDLLSLMWSRRGGMPNSIDELARHLGTDRRVVSRLVDALLKHGKLEIEGDELVNPRLMRMIGPRRRRENPAGTRPEIHPKPARSRSDVRPKSRQICDPPPSTSKTYDTSDDPPISFSTSTAKEETPLSPSAERPRDCRGVELVDGELRLFNGLKARWLEEFDGDEKRLRLGLAQAAGYIQLNSSRPLEAQVSAQLARQLAEKRDKDRRYEAAAARNKGDRSGQGSDFERELDAICGRRP